MKRQNIKSRLPLFILHSLCLICITIGCVLFYTNFNTEKESLAVDVGACLLVIGPCSVIISSIIWKFKNNKL